MTKKKPVAKKKQAKRSTKAPAPVVTKIKKQKTPVVTETKKKQAPRPSPLVALVAKPPKDATIRGQGAVILEVLKEAKGKLTVAELVKKLEGRVTTKNVLGLGDIWHMCRPVLVARGLIKVEEGQ